MPPKERFIRMRTVLDRTALSRATVYRKMADGTFPRQVKISIHGAGWYESEIDRWIANPAGWRAANDNDAPAGHDAVAANDNADVASGRKSG